MRERKQRNQVFFFSFLHRGINGALLVKCDSRGKELLWGRLRLVCAKCEVPRAIVDNENTCCM